SVPWNERNEPLLPARERRPKRWSASGDPRSPRGRQVLLRPVKSRQVTSLRRRVGRLRLLEQPAQVSVAQLAQRALTGTRSPGRIPCDAHLTITSLAAHEDEPELVMRIRRPESRRINLPKFSVEFDLPARHCLHLHPDVDALRVERRRGCRGVGIRESLRIICLGELHECPRKICLRKYREAAVPVGIIRLALTSTHQVIVPLVLRNDQSLDRH